MKAQKEYYLGLDMGTSTLGWAVTDEKYRLMRAKGKDLWGFIDFKEAETSAKTRGYRVSRRAGDRKKARIGLLKELFAEAILGVDPSFYQRLKESRYHLEDKTVGGKNSLFSDENFTDYDYYENYATISHLRRDLIYSNKPHDVRLVFLAILNIFKHRGHFLNANLDADQNAHFSDLFEEFKSQLLDRFEFIADTSRTPEWVLGVLCDKTLSKTKKSEKIAKEYGIKKSKDKILYEILKAICGLTISIEKIFHVVCVNDEGKEVKISFTDNNLDEKMEAVSNALDEEDLDFFELLKAIHDHGLLTKIMGEFTYLSEARVASYGKHHKDLEILKDVIKKYCDKKQYNRIFRLDGKGSYSCYVGSVNSNYMKRNKLKKDNESDNKYIMKELKKLLGKDTEKVTEQGYVFYDPKIAYILREIKNDNFLPRQMTGANGVIPYQAHLAELKAILKNASKYLDFLNAVDDTGLSVSEKIIAIFSFRIPYYIGPVNAHHAKKGGNAWVVRKKKGTVLPWNFEDLIDVKKTSEVFIERLIRKGTYIKDQSVLPKSSLLYEKYMVLNELNTLRIRGEKPSVQLKQQIYHALFLKGKKVTEKKLNAFLISNGIIEANETSAVSGIKDGFSNSLNTFGKFYAIFKEDIFKDKTQAMIERIVYWGTIYGKDKKFYKEIVVSEFGDRLSQEQIKRILGYKFNDWGRLSQEFLQMSGVNKSTGEAWPLIQMLWHCNENLMELLSDKFTYAETLEKEYSAITKTLTDLQYEDLKELYISAPVRRMVWQTLLAVKEIEGVLGNPPKRIFIEMARGGDKKKKETKTRKDRLIALYKSCKNETRDWQGELESRENHELRSKKLYLYYMQKGRCMYSFDKITLEDLMNKDLYDIDHIYPKKLVKDDSLENNLVLVKKEINEKVKKDKYPVPASIIEEQRKFWKSLLSKDMKDGFITREKYNRLISKDELSDEQLAAFINRQLVETRQGTKVVADILNQAFSGSEIVYVKAGNVSDFRQKFDLLKVRSVNDFHHAQDAYLSIVVGNTYNMKFTKNPLNFIKEHRRNKQKYHYHMNKIFKSTVERDGETAWVADASSKRNSIGMVKKMMRKNTPLISKMTYEGHGQLFNVNACNARIAKVDDYLPIKTTDLKLHDVKKYGGYTGFTTAYFFLVEHTLKGKRVRTIEVMPLVYKEKVEKDPAELRAYCENQLKLVDPDVRLAKIKINSLIKRDGYYMNITGKTNERCYTADCMPLKLDNKWIEYIKNVEKVIDTKYVNKEINASMNEDLYHVLMNKHTQTIYSRRPNSIGGKLENGLEKFKNLELYEQCYVINEILKISQLSNLIANLTLIDGKKETGKASINKQISKSKEFILVNQSVTGLYSNEIDLLTI